MKDLLFDTQECASCPIRHRAVCARCEADELKRLEAIKFYRRFEAGQPIVWKGDAMDVVGSMVDGVAALSHGMEDGRTQMVGLLLPSDFLGRPGRREATHDVRAVTAVTLCCFRRRPFEDLVESTPHVAQRLLEMTLDELDAVREWMVVLGRKTAREKIASFLTTIARREAVLRRARAVNGMRFDLPINRDAMADYLGLTIETVSRQISSLKRDNVIVLESKRTVVVPDFARLAAEAGDDSDGGLLC
ncbi:transcriptional regulator FnrL [Tranquillimonas alkanivorans]|nr:Crp/Fnr family transcriptional regulator [Tranquillimonas alkanivorans]